MVDFGPDSLSKLEEDITKLEAKQPLKTDSLMKLATWKLCRRDSETHIYHLRKKEQHLLEDLVELSTESNTKAVSQESTGILTRFKRCLGWN